MKSVLRAMFAIRSRCDLGFSRKERQTCTSIWRRGARRSSAACSDSGTHREPGGVLRDGKPGTLRTTAHSRRGRSARCKGSPRPPQVGRRGIRSKKLILWLKVFAHVDGAVLLAQLLIKPSTVCPIRLDEHLLLRSITSFGKSQLSF